MKSPRQLYNTIADAVEISLKLRKETTPGKNFRLMVGPFNNFHDYEKDAIDFINIVEKLVNLNDCTKILDVGCGAGRLDFEMHVRYPNLEYYGFDINPKLVNWAESVSKKMNGFFNFKYLDVFNRLYNPSGKLIASKFTFPYPDRNFDFVLVQSVFTHMKHDDVFNYLKKYEEC